MDLAIKKILEREQARQHATIELIASENFASKAVMDLCGSVFTNKYAEGLPGKRYYNGCDFADEVEQLAIDYVTRLYGCNFANVQPHSGANANLAVFKALLSPGDVVIGMDLAGGGHLSHGAKVNVSGSWFSSFSYGVNDDGLIDYDYVQKIVSMHSPKMLIAGASAYSRVIDWAKMREIADSVNAYLLADMSHYSGLIAAGVYPSPLPHAHVVTSTTHKTLRGPRGGMILWNEERFTKPLNSAVFPGTQGGPLMHIIAAKAQCFFEALSPEFKIYGQRVIDNSKAMIKAFNDCDVDVISGGTDSHMFVLDLTHEQYNGRQFADLLETKGITVNKNGVPRETRSFVETSGVRIGTAAETTRGHDTEWFYKLGRQIATYLKYT